MFLSLKHNIFLLIAITAIAQNIHADRSDDAQDLSDTTANSIFSISGKWISKEDASPHLELQTLDNGGTIAKFANSSSAIVYFEKERKFFRPHKDDFNKKNLSFDIKIDCKGDEKIKSCIFIKNKDGLWYQSRKVFLVTPHKKTKVSVDLSSSAMEFQPEGHYSAWNCLDRATILSAGISIFDEKARPLTVEIGPPTLSEQRETPDLFIYNLRLPKSVEQNAPIEARFNLSREYFNPFDPEEIQVDIKILHPNFKETIRPAFFTREYYSSLYFNREIRVPFGKPQWAFRFFPQSSGEYKFKIIAKDQKSTIESTWNTFNVAPSKNKGIVRVSQSDQRYFEFSTGEFFYPIGFNIHSVKDLRSEEKLNLGYRPDRGTYSYEEYFDAMAKNKVNAVEIWMAAWSFAIEWTSSRTDYYGLGRYNLFNAWCLDKVLKYARDKGIYVHLVLDNHGKLAKKVDPEWDDSPHNKKRDFAIADGAMLNEPWDFFTDKEAEKYYLQRNRYIAARWGAEPAIFGIEFWSEIDLIDEAKRTHDSGEGVEWHKKMTEHLKSLAIPHIMTTHTCGDYNNPIKYRKYYEEVPLITYLVGDAYRERTPIVEHMRIHTETLKFFKQPLLITEYGGSPQGASFDKLEADLHGGIWASFFFEQAGTPFLWWHDFIHDMKKYHHLFGFSKFIQDIDPRNKKFRHRELTVYSSNDIIQQTVSCLAAGNQNEHYCWLFQKKYMENYPESEENIPEVKGLQISLELMMPETKYNVEFFNTTTGKLILSQILSSDPAGQIKIPIPNFKVDIAIKIRKQN